MEYDLKAKHREEIEELEEKLGIKLSFENFFRMQYNSFVSYEL